MPCKSFSIQKLPIKAKHSGSHQQQGGWGRRMSSRPVHTHSETLAYTVSQALNKKQNPIALHTPCLPCVKAEADKEKGWLDHTTMVTKLQLSPSLIYLLGQCCAHWKPHPLRALSAMMSMHQDVGEREEVLVLPVYVQAAYSTLTVAADSSHNGWFSWVSLEWVLGGWRNTQAERRGAWKTLE